MTSIHQLRVTEEPPHLDDAAFVEWLERQPDNAKFYSATRRRAYHLSNLFSSALVLDYITTMDQPPRIVADQIRRKFARQVAEHLK